VWCFIKKDVLDNYAYRLPQCPHVDCILGSRQVLSYGEPCSWDGEPALEVLILCSRCGRRTDTMIRQSTVRKWGK
jgi:hypothetical protein